MTDWNGDGTHDSYDDYMDYHVACGDDSSGSSGGGGGHHSGGGGGGKLGCSQYILGAVLFLLVIISGVGDSEAFAQILAVILFPVIVFGVIWLFAQI